MRVRAFGAAWVVWGLIGCIPVSDYEAGSYVPPSTASGAGGAAVIQDEPEVVPVDGSALATYLEAGEYLSWAAESSVHLTAGAHYGGVRVYVNPLLFDSLSTGAFEHPVGAAAVSELYGEGEALRGWSVAVKADVNSDFGQGWYWYERYGEWQNADGMGDDICLGCHLVGRDLFMSPFPLE